MGDARGASRDADCETALPPAGSVSFPARSRAYGRDHADPTARFSIEQSKICDEMLLVIAGQRRRRRRRIGDIGTDGADWKEVARIVLHIDPDREPDRARRAWETHLARARWMTEQGYRHLLRGGAPH